MAANQIGKPYGSKRGGARVSTKPRCGRKARSTGETCQRFAGHGTQHPGIGACRYHGGNGGRRIKHGKFSNISKRIRSFVASSSGRSASPYDQTYDQFRQDPTINDVTDEIALLRTLLVALGDVFGDPCATGLLGLTTGVLPAVVRIQLLAELTERIVVCIHRKVEMEKAVAMRMTAQCFEKLAFLTFRAVAEHITDPEVLAAIGASLKRLYGTDPSASRPQIATG